MHSLDSGASPTPAIPAVSDAAVPDIPSMLTSLALTQPDVPALLAPERPTLDFAGLHAQMRYVCDTLGGWGIERGDPVAVLLPRGPEMAAVCALLPAAATCVPLDANASAEACERLFERCAVRALVTLGGTRCAATDTAERMGLMRIGLAAERSAPAGSFELILERRPTARPAPSPCGPGTAYVLSTSGTTARNKLVPVEHRQITAYSAAIKPLYRYVPTDLSIQIVPPHLAHGIKSALMVPLLAGTSIVCPPAFQVDDFFRLLDEYRPTWFTAGFTVYRELLRAADRYRQVIRNARLRFLRVGSGKLEEHEIAALERVFNAPVILNLSSTETCLLAVSPFPPGQRKSGSLGRTLVNEIAIRGLDGRILPPGEEGEIVARGPLVFDGYIDDPELTRQAFVDGWYRTGDMGRLDDEGFLYLTGRIKDVINRGGEKISPAEIDAVLACHPAVADAAAFGLPHQTLGELVVAAVVPRQDVPADENDIRRHLRARLSPTKVPSRIFFVDRLPRLENGKLRRDRLRQTFASRAARA